MRTFFFTVIAILFSLQSTTTLLGQHRGTANEIIFVQEQEDEARQQLRRILKNYDLDTWMFTSKVRIEMGAEPYSHPILTLNTDFLDSDEQQMSIFLHEQAHWFVSESVPYRAPEDGSKVEIIEELRSLFPNSPVSDYRTINHLIVAWVELDAMAELIGEEHARELLKEKIERLTNEPLSPVDQRYKWYNMQVLEYTREIGKILARYDLVITPAKGLIVSNAED